MSHPCNVLQAFLTQLQTQPAILVTVEASRGSTPREVGAWMAVFPHTVVGTIGGGHLEWDALREARQHSVAHGAQDLRQVWRQDKQLGPQLGQCCGGRVVLRFEPVGADDMPMLRQRLQPRLIPLALFGGGHVGHALVQALAPLPFSVLWVDSRDDVFPLHSRPGLHLEHSDPVQAAVPGLLPQSRVLIMSFSHAEDLDVLAACLLRQRQRHDLPFLGLIGSRSKWASFRHRLQARGFSDTELGQVSCPIGLPGIRSKEPAVVAASVVAQLLLFNETQAANTPSVGSELNGECPVSGG